jgi:glycosyltransferase involved in cell wall biosynthesis
MSFVIAAMPAYNEERSIAKMVLGCKKYVDQVVVVDDGSSDATASIAEALGAYVVRHEKNSGYGAALRSCFETARNLGAEKMVIIDSDGQHDAAEIPELLDTLNNGCDLVIGSRFCDGNGENIPAYRKVGMKVLDVATSVAGGVSVTDSQSGFRAYGQRAIESIYIKDSGMSAGSEVLLQAKDNDLSIKEVPIHCRYDVERASTQNPVSHGVKTLIKILHDMELRRPLYYFTVPGILLAAVGVGMGLDFLRVFYHGGSLAYGPTLLMILLTLVGSFLAMTGIILHSISKMMIEFKNEIEQIRKTNHVHGHNAGNGARDN